MAVANAASMRCNCRMTNAITLPHSPSATPRSAALSSIWQLILGAEDVAGSPLVGLKIGNDLAYKILRVGITSKALEPVGEFLGLNKSLIASYLDLDRGTVNGLVAKEQLLPTHAAENVLRFLELEAMAAETFATEAEASAWLSRPHPMLEDESPLAASQTSFGGQRVKDILLAIKYGGAV